MSTSVNNFGFIPFEANENQNNNSSEDFGFTPLNQENPAQEEVESDLGEMQPIASAGAHALGQIPALPGNIRDLAYATGDAAKSVRKKFFDTLGMSWDEEWMKGKESEYQKSEEKITAPFKFLAEKLPNSADVNKFIDEYKGGVLAPKSETSKLANDLSEDIVNSFLNRGPKNLYRNFFAPALANTVRKGAELFGVSPQNQYIAKMLTWIGADLAGLSNPRQMLSHEMEATKRSIPRNDMINIRPRDQRFLDLLEQDLRSGGTSPSVTASLTKIQEMRNSIINGQMPAREALDFYRKINENKTSLGAFNVEGSGGKAAHVRNLNRAQDLSRNMLNRYGLNQNPEFLRDFREVNAAWASLEQSNSIANYVKKNYTKPIASEALKGMFQKSGLTGVGVAAGLTGLERLQATLRRLENPTLRRYYGDVLTASLNDNRAMMINSMGKLDEALKKYEEKD